MAGGDWKSGVISCTYKAKDYQRGDRPSEYIVFCDDMVSQFVDGSDLNLPPVHMISKFRLKEKASIDKGPAEESKAGAEESKAGKAPGEAPAAGIPEAKRIQVHVEIPHQTRLGQFDTITLRVFPCFRGTRIPHSRRPRSLVHATACDVSLLMPRLLLSLASSYVVVCVVAPVVARGVARIIARTVARATVARVVVARV